MSKSLIAEFIGTFALVFVGTGAIIVNELTGGVGDLGIALSFGIVIGVMVYALGNISGAHFNPAVSVGFYYSGQLSRPKLWRYILAQISGALSASSLLFLLFGDVANLGATLPRGGELESFILEIVMTFFLMFVILSVTSNRGAKLDVSGIAIGGAVAMDAIFGGPISGASMNPARSLGPSIVSRVFESQWIYIAAPIIGSLIAVLIYQKIKVE
jgi:aquaporin Z